MARYGIPGMTYLDANGKPLSGGKLWFYEPDTLILKNTYSDSAETIPNTNPIALGADGKPGDIFFSGEAKIIIYDDQGNLITPADPIGTPAAISYFSTWLSTVEYSDGYIVTDSNGNYFVSLVSANLGNVPATSPSAWMEIRFLNTYNATMSYSAGDVCISNDILYISLVGTNTGNAPASSPAQWRSLSAGLFTKQTAKTSAFAAEVGVRYLCDTATTAAFTATLPITPNEGEIVGFVDYVGNFNTDNLTIARNGELIMNDASDLICDINYASIELQYTTARGWILI